MPFLHPSITSKSLDILPGMRIADFGCGSGHWAVELAKAVGPSGKIFAVDAQESALEATRSEARRAHLQNIETIRANVEAPGATTLKEETMDAVIISNMLFQADKKQNVVLEAARVTKHGGRVFLIDWDNTIDAYASRMGPPSSQPVTRQDAEHLFASDGFRFEKEFNAGSHHYGLMFRKQ